jgi:cardiolipin synthase
MTTANKITIVRILLVPLFIVLLLYYFETNEELYRFLALMVFGLAAISDGVDGYIARRYNQRSELGAVLDPLADKFLLVSAVVLLSIKPGSLARIPIWVTGTILGRDVLVVIGIALVHYTFGKVVVRPRWTGKLATVLQMAVVLWTLFRFDPTWLRPLYMGTALFSLVSGLFYLWDGISQLSASPTSSASNAGPKTDAKTP